MKEKLEEIIRILEEADVDATDYHSAKNALIKIYRQVNNCSFKEAEKIISEATSDDQMFSTVDLKSQRLLAIAKGLQLVAKESNELKSSKEANSISKKTNPRKVFVVHGRNNRLRNDMFSFLRAIKLEPIEWAEAIKLTGSGSPHIAEILDAAFAEAQAIVVLLTPDDAVRLKPEFISKDDPPFEKEETGQARPNVLFEAGMAFGRNPHKTILIQVGSIKPFSDIGGRHIIKLDNSSAQRQDVVNRLKNADCDVSNDGTDWQTIGDFQL